jgi:hypothetical protein
MPTEQPLVAALGPQYQPNEFRGGDYVHVSDLIGKCLRMIAIHRVTGLPIPSEPMSDFLGLTFDMGNAIHDYVRRKITTHSPDAIYGNWSCACHASSWIGTFTDVRGEACGTCGCGPRNYGEMVIRNEEYKIVGSIDLTMLIENVFYLSEIKSIKHDVWQGMTGPLPDHMLQIMMYWELARLAGWPIYDTVSVIYVTKGFQFSGSPYKEFVLEASQYTHRIAPLFEDAKELAECTDADTLPPNLDCPARNAPKARKCPMVTPCFEFEQDA